MELVYFPDERLREVSKKISTIDAALREAVPKMFEVMYAARGIGLAGPQVGLNRRIIVANLEGDSEVKNGEQVFINPQIVDKSGELREEEGCLSLPGLAIQVRRHQTVLVRYQTLDGETVEREASDLESRMFQHEIDHLDGILLVDKMSPADKKQWAPFLAEMEEDFASRRPPRRKVARRRAPAADA